MLRIQGGLHECFLAGVRVVVHGLKWLGRVLEWSGVVFDGWKRISSMISCAFNLGSGGFAFVQKKFSEAARRVIRLHTSSIKRK